jgi:hypothetical protein
MLNPLKFQQSIEVHLFLASIGTLVSYAFVFISLFCSDEMRMQRRIKKTQFYDVPGGDVIINRYMHYQALCTNICIDDEKLCQNISIRMCGSCSNTTEKPGIRKTDVKT